MRKKSFYLGVLISLLITGTYSGELYAVDFRGFSPERTSLGVTIQYDRGGASTMTMVREIKKLDQLLVKYMRLTPSVLARSAYQPCQILLSDSFPAGHFAISGGNTVTLEISLQDNGDFFFDPAKFQQLVGAMFFSRLGIYRGNAKHFPFWISCGLMAELAKMRSYGRLMVDSADYPLLRALLEDGKGRESVLAVGAFAVDPGKLPPAALEYYYELCRFWNAFWHRSALGGEKFIFDYTVKSATSDNPDDSDLLTEKLAEAGIVGELLLREMDKIVFDVFHPRSGAGAEKFFADWQKFELELLDVEGEKIGEKAQVTITDMPSMIDENPNYTTALAERGFRLEEFANQCDFDVQIELLSLKQTLERIIQSPSRLRRNRRELEKALSLPLPAFKRQMIREEYILGVEREFLAPGVSFILGSGVPESRSIIGEEGEQVIELAEKRFLAD